MPGWVGGWSPSDNKANLSLTRLKLDLPTWTELGSFIKNSNFLNFLDTLFLKKPPADLFDFFPDVLFLALYEIWHKPLRGVKKFLIIFLRPCVLSQFPHNFPPLLFV